MRSLEEYLEVGEIVTTIGVKGEVKVNILCDNAEILLSFKRLFLDKSGVEIVKKSGRTHKNQAVMKFAGYDTIEQAETLRGMFLYAARKDFKLPENSYFLVDLVGLEVSDYETGEIYGVITEVLQPGANDVYVVKGKDSKNPEKEREYLIPAIADVVKITDIENGIMKITPIDGLFDI